MRVSGFPRLIAQSFGMIGVAVALGYLFAPHVLRSETPMSVWVVPGLVRVGQTDAAGRI